MTEEETATVGTGYMAAMWIRPEKSKLFHQHSSHTLFFLQSFPKILQTYRFVKYQKKKRKLGGTQTPCDGEARRGESYFPTAYNLGY